MNDEQLIMTVKEFRRIAGKATAHFSDEQVIELIQQLDFLGGMYVKKAISRKEQADKVET